MQYTYTCITRLLSVNSKFHVKFHFHPITHYYTISQMKCSYFKYPKQYQIVKLAGSSKFCGRNHQLNIFYVKNNIFVKILVWSIFTTQDTLFSLIFIHNNILVNISHSNSPIFARKIYTIF